MNWCTDLNGREIQSGKLKAGIKAMSMSLNHWGYNRCWTFSCHESHSIFQQHAFVVMTLVSIKDTSVLFSHFQHICCSEFLVDAEVLDMCQEAVDWNGLCFESFPVGTVISGSSIQTLRESVLTETVSRNPLWSDTEDQNKQTVQHQGIHMIKLYFKLSYRDAHIFQSFLYSTIFSVSNHFSQ